MYEGNKVAISVFNRDYLNLGFDYTLEEVLGDNYNEADVGWDYSSRTGDYPTASAAMNAAEEFCKKRGLIIVHRWVQEDE